MIKFDERFSAEHDGRQWVLTERYMGKASKKDGVLQEPKEQTRESYHGTLRQVCKRVLDATAAESSGEDVVSAEKLIDYLENKEWLLEGICRGFE